jgi:hypothetical protein
MSKTIKTNQPASRRWHRKITPKALGALASFYEAEHQAGLGHRFVTEARRLAAKAREAAK